MTVLIDCQADTAASCRRRCCKTKTALWKLILITSLITVGRMKDYLCLQYFDKKQLHNT